MDLPEAEKHVLKLGYLPLTDAAPLIVAKELGFFDDLGLDVTLKAEVSWANLRDKLATGALDGAQMLAPLPAMSTLGISGLRVPLITGLFLSRNGNAITLSKDLLASVDSASLSGNSYCPASLLQPLIEGNRKLVFGVVHAFSTHALLLRKWLRASDISPESITTIVVPPSQVVDSMETGIIDGFCVGEPWGTYAVMRGAGFIAAAGVDIWPNAPEKVFCVKESWHEQNPGSHLRARVALLRANEWLRDPDNLHSCVQLLAGKNYLDISPGVLEPSLTGRLVSGLGEPDRRVENFHLFGDGFASRPRSELGEELIGECLSMVGREIDPSLRQSVARRTYRPDLFEETAGYARQLAALDDAP